MKSETQRWFGLSALNGRLTLSSGRGAFESGIVVRTTLPRNDATQALPAHQPLDRATGHRVAFAVEPLHA